MHSGVYVTMDIIELLTEQIMCLKSLKMSHGNFQAQFLMAMSMSVPSVHGESTNSLNSHN